MTKKVLLVIAYQGYQPIEYGYTRKVLEDAGIIVEVASNKMGSATALPSENHKQACDDSNCTKAAEQNQNYAHAAVDITLDAVNVEKYKGIFLIGGPGALEFLDNTIVYGIMRIAAQMGKIFGAICISPRILAHAGLLYNKRATCWDGDGKVEGIFKQYGVSRVQEQVVVDKNIITAEGPQSALLFGQAIVDTLDLIK